MHTEHIPDDPEVLKEMGYDRRDLNVPLIRKASIVITVACIVMFIISVPVYNYYSSPGKFFSVGSHLGANREPAPESRTRLADGLPALQDNVNTKMDIADMRKNETEHLTVPAWIDKEKGIVRVPIRTAMEKVAERGVSTGNSVVAKPTGNTIQQNAEGPGNSKPLQ